MKKALFLALVLGFVVFFSLSALAITIGFEPVSQEVVVGDPASVNLVISGLGDGTYPSLGGFDLFIEYDPTILALSDVSFGDPTLGDQLAIGWGATYLSSTYSSSIEELFGLSFGPPWDLINFQAPSFVLATLTFDTLSVGTSPLEYLGYRFANDFILHFRTINNLDFAILQLPLFSNKYCLIMGIYPT